MDSPLLPSTSKLQDNLFDVSADQLQFGDLSFEDTPQQPRRTYQHQDLSFEESGRHHRPEYADDASLRGGDASYIEQETPPRQQKPGPSKPRFSLFAAPASPLRDEDDDEDEDEPERQETRPSMSSSSSRRDDISSPTGSSQDDASDRSRARPLSLSQLGSADSPPHMMRLQQHPPQQSSEERDASLRRALFELQRINAVFEQYAEGLEEVNVYHSVRRSHPSYSRRVEGRVCLSASLTPYWQRIQAQTATTDALLESYISILSATNATSQLIFDPTWHGADSVSLHRTCLFHETPLICSSFVLPRTPPSTCGNKQPSSLPSKPLFEPRSSARKPKLLSGSAPRRPRGRRSRLLAHRRQWVRRRGAGELRGAEVCRVGWERVGLEREEGSRRGRLGEGGVCLARQRGGGQSR